MQRLLRGDQWWASPRLWVEWFLVANMAFLAVDIALAHAVNAFEHRAEWIPIFFSVAATFLLLLAIALGGSEPALTRGEGTGAIGWRQRLARGIGLTVGWSSIAVGIAGLIWHLRSDFFQEQTIKNLVYTAPFAAPLAYTGLGLLLILDRMVDARSLEWSRWVILLAAGGFAGNFVLSLADHAQNGIHSVSSPPIDLLAQTEPTERKNGMNSVEQNLTVDPSHACSLRAGAALFPCPPLAAGCIDHSGCNDLRQSLSCGILVAAV